MRRDEIPGLRIHPLDVLLQDAGLDPPLSPATDLDGGQVAASHQCVCLCGGDVEDLGDVGELQKPGASRRHRVTSSHQSPVGQCATGWLWTIPVVHSRWRTILCGSLSGRRAGGTVVHTDTRTTQSPAVAPITGQNSSPQAARLRRARWLDPRLIIGLLLVLGSVVAGTRVIAAADRTVPVLVAAADLVPGQTLRPELVETRNVVLDGNLDSYVTGDVGPGYVVVRSVTAGELLPRSSIAAVTDDRALRYITIALPAVEVPFGLVAGDLVDVW